MLAETRNRGPRRNGPVSTAGHDQLGAGGKLDRHRRAARVAQLLPAAGRTLRAGCHVMLDDGRAQQIETDDVIAQIRAKVGGDRFGDLDSRKLDAALSERLAASGETATRRACLRSSSALTSRLRFMRSARQVQQALLPGLNTGPTRGKMPEG